jgi:hypothetical protein
MDFVGTEANPRTGAAMALRDMSEEQKIAWWVEKACERELPVLSGTLGEIDRALSNEEYSAFALARVILQDPPLTTRVLRVANSVFYNPGGRPISMVSRAVIILGFDAVRSICTSIAIIEALLSGVPRGRLLDEIARALHAAVVARFLARQRHDPAPEEVFVSTLLQRIGHMVFWSLGGPEVDALDEALKLSPEGGDRLEVEVVGFPIRKLSTSLSVAWRLPTLPEGSGARSESRKAVEEVAWAIAIEAPKGWGGSGVKRVARDAAWILSCDEHAAIEILKKLAIEAADYALALGSKDVSLRIPSPSEPSSSGSVEADPSAMGEADKDAEMQVLHEITSNLLDRLDVNSIFQMVLEGIHRGVGMDRTALAIVDPRTGEVRCKLALGKHRKEFMERFHFLARDARPHALIEIVEKCGSQLLDPLEKDMDGKYSHPVYGLFEDKPFLAQAVAVGGKTVGLFVADRHASGRRIDREAWDNFRLLGRQADIALTMAASGRLA